MLDKAEDGCSGNMVEIAATLLVGCFQESWAQVLDKMKQVQKEEEDNATCHFCGKSYTVTEDDFSDTCSMDCEDDYTEHCRRIKQVFTQIRTMLEASKIGLGTDVGVSENLRNELFELQTEHVKIWKEFAIKHNIRFAVTVVVTPESEADLLILLKDAE